MTQLTFDLPDYYTPGVWDLGLSVRHICFMAPPKVGAFRRGEITRNSRSIARNFNAAMESIGRTIRPKSQTLWVYIKSAHLYICKLCTFSSLYNKSKAI